MKCLAACRFLLAVFALGGGACTTLPRGGGIGVTVADVRPLQASLLESSIALTLRLTNEALQPLTLAGSSHRLFLNGSYVGRAVSNERLTLPPLGTATQTVTVYLENLTLVRKAAELSNAPKINYRLESRLHPADGDGFGSIKAVATGELDLSGLGLLASGQPRE